MAIKQFSFWQVADLRVEGVGMMHGGYSIMLTIKDMNTSDGRRNVHISATGRTNAAKVAGSGKVLFWCNVLNSIDNKKYTLNRKPNEMWVVGMDDVYIGDVSFFIPKDTYFTPSIHMECGYIYADYTGQVVPMPRSMSREIKLTKFHL